MEIDVYRSYIVNLKEQDMYLVLDSSMLLAKNVYNSAMFLLHNLIYSYDYDKANKTYTVKRHLHRNQIETIDFFNHVIVDLNTQRLKKFNKQQKTKQEEKLNHHDQSNNEENNKEKEFVCLSLLTDVIDIKSFRNILLDKTLLEHVVKHKETVKPEFIDFRKVPSIVAQYAAHKAVDDINTYFKTLAAYFKSFKAGQKANVPQLPKYLGKNDRLTIELSSQRFAGRDYLFKINPKKHTLYHDFYNKVQSVISKNVIDKFNQFNLKQAIDDALNKRINKQDKKQFKNNNHLDIENKKDFTLQTIRFVPHKQSGKGKNKYSLKVEAIVAMKETIGQHSSLAQIITYYNINKATYKKPTLNFEQLPSNIQQKVILDYVKNNPTEFVSLAGCDMGMNNILALAFTHGKNQIYSATHINRELTKLNVKLDRLKSDVFKTLLSPELLVKVLKNRDIAEQNKDIVNFNKSITDDNEKLELLDKEKLTLEELKSIKLATSFLYENKNYQKTLIKLENYKKNILHQLSEQVVSHCIKNKTQCIVIGQNKNWKQELNMGKRNNRLFLSLPHGLLIEQINYKALAKGIVVITTEESYTSQASFINADEMPVFSNKEKSNKNLEKYKLNNNIKDFNNTKVVDTEKTHSHEVCNVQGSINNASNINNTVIKISKSQRFSGTRKQHSYTVKKTCVIKNKPIKIHADINGAFNIVCKVFEKLIYDKSIDLNYELRGCSNKTYDKNKIQGKTNKNKTSNNDKRKSVVFSLLYKYEF